MPTRQWDGLTLDTNAHAACSVIKGLAFKDAIDLTLASGKKYGEGFSGFVPLAKAQGISRDELIRKMNQKYHEIMFKKVQKHFPDTLSVPKGTVAAFNKLGPGTKHALLTHSCSKYWTEPTLAKMGLSYVFNKKAILDFEEIGFVHKNSSAEPVRKALMLLGERARDTIFVEDDPKNIAVAKKRYPRLTTVLISKTATVAPDSVDLVVKDPYELLQLLLSVQGPSKKVKPIPIP